MEGGMNSSKRPINIKNITGFAMEKDEFLALHMMSYIFLQHRKYDKAGIILKTLHQIAPDDEKVRVSLAFVFSTFDLLDEAEELIQSLLLNTI